MNAAATLNITSADQHQFSAGIFRSDDERAPVLIFNSALGTPSKVYRGIASAFAEHGITVCTPDWRGIASSSVRASRRCDFGYRHLLELDAPALIDAVQTHFPGAPIWLGGHSLGGQLAALTAATNTNAVCGLVPIASGSVFLPCFPKKSQQQIRFLGTIIKLAGPVLGYFPGQRMGFGGREANGVMRDWFQVAGSGRYQPVGSETDYEAALASLRIPVLSVNFEHDSFAPAAAANYLMAKLSGCAPEKWQWTEDDTAGIKLDHYSWLKHPAIVVPRVASWLLKHA